MISDVVISDRSRQMKIKIGHSNFTLKSRHYFLQSRNQSD